MSSSSRRPNLALIEGKRKRADMSADAAGKRVLTKEEQDRVNKRLLKAAEWGDVPGVKQALNAGANINIKDEQGDTALHLAAYWGREAIVRVLLEAGADIDIQDNTGSTALDLGIGATAQMIRDEQARRQKEIERAGVDEVAKKYHLAGPTGRRTKGLMKEYLGTHAISDFRK